MWPDVLYPKLIGQNATGWSRTSENATAGAADDDNYLTIKSVTLPGGTMGPNSKLAIYSEWDVPSSATTKYCAIDFGGTNVGQPTMTSTQITLKLLTEIQNLNSLSSQKTANGSGPGSSANPRLSSSINTANDVVIDFRVKWGGAASAETVTLLSYSIWHYPGV